LDDSIDYPAIETLVPHRGAMCLLDKVLKKTDDEVVCIVTINESSLFLEKGKVDSWIGIEYMAQCVSVHAGFVALHQNKATPIGLLLGSRCVDIKIDAFLLHQSLQVTSKKIWQGEDVTASFACDIKDLEKQNYLLKANLSVYSPESVAILES